MKPKNDCQRKKSRDIEQKMVGRKEGQIVEELMANKWKKRNYLEV